MSKLLLAIAVGVAVAGTVLIIRRKKEKFDVFGPPTDFNEIGRARLDEPNWNAGVCDDCGR